MNTIGTRACTRQTRCKGTIATTTGYRITIRKAVSSTVARTRPAVATSQTGSHVSLAAALPASPAAGWCYKLAEHEPLSEAQTAWLARLRNGFLKLTLLFEPQAAPLVQTETPAAGLADALEAAVVVGIRRVVRPEVRRRQPQGVSADSAPTVLCISGGLTCSHVRITRKRSAYDEQFEAATRWRSRSSADKPLFGTSRRRPNFFGRLA
jgi:hypothetical protein